MTHHFTDWQLDLMNELDRLDKQMYFLNRRLAGKCDALEDDSLVNLANHILRKCTVPMIATQWMDTLSKRFPLSFEVQFIRTLIPVFEQFLDDGIEDEMALAHISETLDNLKVAVCGYVPITVPKKNRQSVSSTTGFYSTNDIRTFS